MHVAIHVNPSLSHQREHGECFYKGFKRHGIKASVTHNRNAEADIHVISGPHYAKQTWLDHPRVILLDRCFYKGDPEHVSLGWMKSDGTRTYAAGIGRESLRREDRGAREGTIFLADYNGPLEQADTIRLHPARENNTESLHDALCRHATAIGYLTTALVTAGLLGLEVICRDERSIMAQPNWLELLPYADWHLKEIASGEAWEHLRN